MLSLYNETLPFKAHIEITDQCNARCPQCPRNIILPKSKNLREHPNLKNSWITYDQFVKIFSGHEDDMNQVIFSGNFGDPVFNPDFEKILKHTIDHLIHKDKKIVAKEHSPRGNGILRGHVKTCTNGGFRKPEWWAKLAKDTIPHTECYDNVMCFAIDGLEDTHHLYRVNTRFDRVIENAKAWIGAGGKAEWQFIRFEHNIHQEQAARDLSKELGFAQFQVVDSSRGSIEEFNFKGENYFLKMPEKSEEFKSRQSIHYKNKGLDEDHVEKTPYVDYPTVHRGPANAKDPNEEITCVEANMNRIYIDCEGFIYPCCWIGTHQYHMRNQTRSLYDKGDVLFNKTYDEKDKAWNRPFVDILHDAWFEYILPESWDTAPCTICTQNCGKKEIRTKRESDYYYDMRD